MKNKIKVISLMMLIASITSSYAKFPPHVEGKEQTFEVYSKVLRHPCAITRKPDGDLWIMTANPEEAAALTVCLQEAVIRHGILHEAAPLPRGIKAGGPSDNLDRSIVWCNTSVRQVLEAEEGISFMPHLFPVYKQGVPPFQVGSTV